MSRIAEPGSYSIENFIPFTEDIYFRLFERQFDAWWPLHLLMSGLGLGILILACYGRIRSMAFALAIPLAVTALTFHRQLYAELTPVGQFFGWAFLVQGALILIWGFAATPGAACRPKVHTLTGFAIAAFALTLYPVLDLLAGRGWRGAAYFGLAPDPTIGYCLGIALICARPIWWLLLLPVPLLWTFTTAATLNSLAAPFAMSLPILAALTLAAGSWRAIAGYHQSRHP